MLVDTHVVGSEVRQGNTCEERFICVWSDQNAELARWSAVLYTELLTVVQ